MKKVAYQIKKCISFENSMYSYQLYFSFLKEMTSVNFRT